MAEAPVGETKSRPEGHGADEAPLRDRFRILGQRTYLNTCSLGAYGAGARRRVEEFYGDWASIGAPAWYETWWDRVEETRKAFGRIVGADASEVAVLPSVSVALSVLASCFEATVERPVVTSRLDFPTIPYNWLARPGAPVRFVGGKEGIAVPLAEYEEALEAGASAVATSHVLYATGAIQPVAGICAKARKEGALSIIDSYQGAGQLPVDVRQMGCDVFLAGGLKWLLGGPGCVLMYVRKDLVEQLAPAATGWFANDAMFDFDPERFERRATAARFETGTHGLPSVFGTLGGMETVLDVGIERIRRRQTLLGNDLRERLTDAGYTVHGPEEPEERAGIFTVPVTDAPAAVKRLFEKGITVDHRQGRVRVSPYFYNTLEENERFVDGLVEVAPAPREG